MKKRMIALVLSLLLTLSGCGSLACYNGYASARTAAAVAEALGNRLAAAWEAFLEDRERIPVPREEKEDPTRPTAEREASAFPTEEAPPAAETEPPVPEISADPNYAPRDGDLVRVRDYLPGISVDLRYAREDNFTGRRVYDFGEAYLRWGTVKKLEKVRQELALQGLDLRIWDAYRPMDAQDILWNAVPDVRYVANPANGPSRFSRGGTVAVTLVDPAGREREMPSGFDEFSALGDRDYSEVSEIARTHAQLLEDAMEANGFQGFQGAWWQFSDADSYGYEDIQPLAVYSGVDAYVAHCNEFISLRPVPDATVDRLCKIPLGEEIQLLGGSYGVFLRVRYQGMEGYVMGEYVEK